MAMQRTELLDCLAEIYRKCAADEWQIDDFTITQLCDEWGGGGQRVEIQLRITPSVVAAASRTRGLKGNGKMFSEMTRDERAEFIALRAETDQLESPSPSDYVVPTYPFGSIARKPTARELAELDSNARSRRREARRAVKAEAPKAKAKAKPRTPAGASAAREIIFDD